MTAAILPGATVGIMGGGQLARMMALEARRMGYRIAVMDPDPHACAMSLADIPLVGALDDVVMARRLASVSDVITIDTEHVPADILEGLEALAPVRPAGRVLRVVQDRLTQRRFLSDLHAPQPVHADVSDEASLEQAAANVGFPAVLKTRRSGYDGRGQARVEDRQGLIAAWRAMDQQAAVLEAFVPFEKEVSVVVARDPSGAICAYPLVENVHRKHVLHQSRMPADVEPRLARQAEELARQIVVGLDHVGVLAVELFVTKDRRLLVNEIAPRTHNSGHITWGACVTSQFEQHLRAICGLPLGDPSLLRPAVMLNLMGDVWLASAPDWSLALKHPSARLHLYEKRGARAGRKMGHILIFERDDLPATQVAQDIVQALEAQPVAPPVAQEEPSWSP